MPTVVIDVRTREGFHGFGSTGVYWRNGPTTAEVTDEQLAELKFDEARGFLRVLTPEAFAAEQAPEPAAAAADPAPSGSTTTPGAQ